MPCNCNKNKTSGSASSNTVYVVTLSNGSTKQFTSKTDAELYAARSGGKVSTAKR